MKFAVLTGIVALTVLGMAMVIREVETGTLIWVIVGITGLGGYNMKRSMDAIK